VFAALLQQSTLSLNIQYSIPYFCVGLLCHLIVVLRNLFSAIKGLWLERMKPSFLLHTKLVIQIDIITVFIFLYWFIQRCTNSVRQVAVATKFCTLAPSTIRSSVCNMIHITVLAHRIHRQLIDCWEVCAPLDLHITLECFYVTPQQVSHRHHVCILIKIFLHRVMQLVCHNVSRQCFACLFKVAAFSSRSTWTKSRHPQYGSITFFRNVCKNPLYLTVENPTRISVE